MPTYRVTVTAPDGQERVRNLEFSTSDIDHFGVHMLNQTTQRAGLCNVFMFPYPRDGFGTRLFGSNTFGG